MARFEGMYYRNDLPEKYRQGYWVTAHEHYRTLPVEQLRTVDFRYIGNSFEYHSSWVALIEAWLNYQRKYQESYPKHIMVDSKLFKEFAAGIANDNILQLWKALANACYLYLKIFNI